MRVAFVTNWGDQCSISEYANNLIKHLPEGVGLKVVGHPLTFEHVVEQIKDADVIHMNYIGFWMDHGLLEKLRNEKASNQKLTITYQETPDVSLLGEDSFADAIILHEPKGTYSSKVHLIPNGIRLVDVTGVEKTRKIGSCGFSAPHKGFNLVADAAQKLGVGCLLLMSQSICYDSADAMAEAMRKICSSAEIDTRWLAYDEVVRRMAGCEMTIFPYDLTAYSIGIGNAVRFGIAAERPVLVQRGHSHFRDLVDYEDEIYFIDNNDVIGTAQKVFQDIENGCERLPKKLLVDMCWKTCAEKYVDVWKKL